MADRQMKWAGDPATTKCDICSHLVSESPMFFDAKTVDGPWALLCFDCFGTHGRGIGIGLGQAYDGTTFEKLIEDIPPMIRRIK